LGIGPNPQSPNPNPQLLKVKRVKLRAIIFWLFYIFIILINNFKLMFFLN
jgi:hypothetical protein